MHILFGAPILTIMPQNSDDKDSQQTAKLLGKSDIAAVLSHKKNSDKQKKNSKSYGTIVSSAAEGGSAAGDNSAESSSSTTAATTSADSPNSSGSSTPEHMKSTLSVFQKFGFGLGHVYNDLCAGVWFSYTLLFMQRSLLIPGPEAGALVMLGQVCDALSTPIVGLLADRYGTKRKWHIFGTGLVFLSFPMIFAICPWCKFAPIWWMPTYFGFFILIFQFAWAVVQISHLAMIPEMSRTTKDRSDLTATRYSASVCSNVIVFIITWAVLQGRSTQINPTIGPSDAFRFRDIALILTLVGLSLSVLFQFSLTLSGYDQRRILSLATKRLRKPSETRRQLHARDDEENIEENGGEYIVSHRTQSESDRLITPHDTRVEEIKTENPTVQQNTNSPDNLQQRRYKNFLKSPLLYQNAFLYVFSRLFMTTSLLYMPLWLDERAGTPSQDDSGGNRSVEHIATVPLVSFLASFIASMGLKHMTRYCGHRAAYSVGSVISIVACAWVAFATPITASSAQLFTIAILLGAGSSITMISSLCITADMIGNHTYQGGFIYSAVTFADKLITGIAVIVIENLKCQNTRDCPEYYRNVLASACGVAAVLGLVTLTTLSCTRRCRRTSRLNDNAR